jgi:hypothetical protein
MPILRSSIWGALSLAVLAVVGWAAIGSADDAPAVPEIDPSFAIYRGQEHFKAMVQGDGNLFFVSQHQCSPEQAVDKAFQKCQESPLRKMCKLIGLGNADVSGLDERGLARVKREYALSRIPAQGESADRVSRIPALLVGRHTPYLTGVAPGFLVYDREPRCIAAVWAYFESDFICMGVTQFQERTGVENAAALGTLDFSCAPNLEIVGRYVSVTDGAGLAAMSDGKGGELYAVYGMDVPEAGVEADGFLELWRRRAAAASGVPGFPAELELQE